MLLTLALPAHADLYRWVDPQSGSVKLSSQRPLDPAIDAELIPFARATLPLPAAPVIVAKERSPEPAVATSSLEVLLQRLFSQLAGVTSADFARGGAGLRQQVEAYEAVRAELDRVDPAGAARRRAASAGLAGRLREGLRSQLNPAPLAK